MLDVAKAFADSLKRAREKQHLTQEQAAEKTGLYKKTILNIENVKEVPKLDTSAEIIRALHIDPMEIFYPESLQQSRASQHLRMLISQCSEEEAEQIMTVLPQLLAIIRK
jgi:DNA-binding XRE family transcriptional regulator